MSFSLRRIGLRVAATTGTPVYEASLTAYDLAAVALNALRVAPKVVLDLGVFVQRFNQLIVQTARLVALASFSAGAVMAIQFGAGMSRFGAKNYVPIVVANSVLSALAPMLASLMAAARSGGGMAAEIGGMVITQQIDAIEALGSDPYRKIYAPSIAALVIGLPLLTLVADFSGLVGGLLIEVTTLGLSFTQALDKTVGAVHLTTAFWAVAKTMVSGFIIGLVATREGRSARGGATGIGEATTSAVIKGTVGVLIADLILTRILTVLL